MATTTALNTARDHIERLVPGGASGLAQLSDDELLANTRRLVGRSNELLATLLAHLAEVETRGVHRVRRCPSLYTYCIYELRFSEDAAARRSAAARIVKQFPILLDAVADGELHLTGLLMIGPHLTPENHVKVLARAKFRTKKELAKLVRELNPLPQVPDRIEALGPALSLAPRTPTWAEFAASLCPPVRELPVGERPRDWASDGIEADGAGESRRASAGQRRADDRSLPVGPVPSDLLPVTGPQHCQRQFSTVEQHVQLIERAKSLLARERPGATLGELHFEAMRMFVAALEKRKFAVTKRPRRAMRSETGVRLAPPTARSSEPQAQPEHSQDEPLHRDAAAKTRCKVKASESPRQRGGAPTSEGPEARAIEHASVSTAADTFARPSGAKCIGETRDAARTSTSAASAAARRGTSSFITSSHSPRAARMWRRIWLCGALPTMHLPRKKTSAKRSLREGETRRNTKPS